MNPGSVRENRREPRRAANGEVRIWLAIPQMLEVKGQLVDLSVSGFRMAHDCAVLEAGQIVEFSHSETAGRARVIWNRIAGARVETGFLVEA